MDTSPIATPGRHRRRRHSAQFKVLVIRAYLQPGCRSPQWHWPTGSMQTCCVGRSSTPSARQVRLSVRTCCRRRAPLICQNGTNEGYNGRLRDECLERRVISRAARGARRDRGLPSALQRRPAALEPELLDPDRVPITALTPVHDPQPSCLPGMNGPRILGYVGEL